MNRPFLALALALAAFTAAGVGSASTIPAPPPPAHLTAQSGGNTEVALTWESSAGATSYVIFRSTTQNDTNPRQVAQDITTTSHKVERLQNDTTYYFKVRAAGPGGMSGFSGEASAMTAITKAPLPDGIYTLAPKHAPQLRLQAAGEAAALVRSTVVPAQHWTLTSINLATYKISPARDPSLALTSDGRTVNYAARPDQLWTLTSAPGGYRLTPQPEPAFALQAAGDADGATVGAATADGSRAQIWNILPPVDGDGAPDPGTTFVPPGYKLVFSDEFDGRTLDTEKWEPLAPFSQPHLNEEMENYLPEAVTLEDGYGVLAAERHDSTCFLADKIPAPHCLGKHQWRSGSITTRSVYQHGYFEARLKVPQGIGLWPAFWLTSSRRWPPEWDILEIPNTVGTLYQYPHPTRRGKVKHVGGLAGPDSIYAIADGMPNPYGGYVVYACETTPTFVKMWVNGKLTIHWEVTGDTIDPMWVALNLAVGGKWPGPPDDTTPNPSRMFIDYLRIYQSDAVAAEVQAYAATQPPIPERKPEDN
ncbi:MAG TPA: family 16 glycosylhydrolase [Lacunisphaera sp.]|nr:family 16 glycosylhydrolase [Lacunisphaera sp.]